MLRWIKLWPPSIFDSRKKNQEKREKEKIVSFPLVFLSFNIRSNHHYTVLLAFSP